MNINTDNLHTVENVSQGQSVVIIDGVALPVGPVYITNSDMDLSFITATSDDIISGKVGSDKNGNPILGNITDQTNNQIINKNKVELPSGMYRNNTFEVGSLIEGEIITPSTYDQVIPDGTYLDGNLVVSGDFNLIPSNIAEGKEIFGVKGTHKSNLSIEFYKCEVVHNSSGIEIITVSGCPNDSINGIYHLTEHTTGGGTMPVYKSESGYYIYHNTSTYQWAIGTDYESDMIYRCSDIEPWGKSWYDLALVEMIGMEVIKSSTINDLKTWDGYKAILTNGSYVFDDELTTGLIFSSSSLIPEVGGIYSSDALIEVKHMYFNDSSNNGDDDPDIGTDNDGNTTAYTVSGAGLTGVNGNYYKTDEVFEDDIVYAKDDMYILRFNTKAGVWELLQTNGLVNYISDTSDIYESWSTSAGGIEPPPIVTLYSTGNSGGGNNDNPDYPNGPVTVICEESDCSKEATHTCVHCNTAYCGDHANENGITLNGDCSGYHCNNCRSNCETCLVDGCNNEVTSVCSDCGVGFCSDHAVEGVVTCTACNQVYCNACIEGHGCTNPETCSWSTCDKTSDLIECSDCGKKFCSEHLVECTICNTMVCSDCYQEKHIHSEACVICGSSNLNGACVVCGNKYCGDHDSNLQALPCGCVVCASGDCATTHKDQNQCGYYDNPKTCSACGTEVTDNYSTCSNCGLNYCEEHKDYVRFLTCECGANLCAVCVTTHKCTTKTCSVDGCTNNATQPCAHDGCEQAYCETHSGNLTVCATCNYGFCPTHSSESMHGCSSATGLSCVFDGCDKTVEYKCEICDAHFCSTCVTVGSNGNYLCPLCSRVVSHI